MGVKGARFHGSVNGESLWNIFCCQLCIFYCQTTPELLYDKRYDFNFEIVNFQFPDGAVPRYPSYGVYHSQLIRFARVCSNVDDFNNRNLFLTAKLLKQGIDIIKFVKHFLHSTTDTQSRLLNTILV